MSFEEFSERDYVTADFYFKNREINTKNGVWKKEEKRIVWMKHAELESNNRPTKVKGEITTTEIDSRLMAEIPIPEPGADDDMSDLPF